MIIYNLLETDKITYRQHQLKNKSYLNKTSKIHRIYGWKSYIDADFF